MLDTDSNGTAHVTIETKLISLIAGKKNNVLGRSIVVQVGQDDWEKDETAAALINGASGNRIACCLIGVAGY